MKPAAFRTFAKFVTICLQHLDELEVHKTNVEKEILCLVQQYPYQLELLQTVLGFSGNIMTAIALISEIGADMSVFPSAKHLVSWAGCCPRNDQSSKKVKSTRISRAGVYLKPLLVQVAIQPFTANADKLSAAGALEIRCQICDGRFLSMWAALFIFLGCPLSPCPKNLHVHNGRICSIRVMPSNAEHICKNISEYRSMIPKTSCTP